MALPAAVGVKGSRARNYSTMLGREAIPNYSMVTMRGSGLWRWRRSSAGLAFSGHAIVAFKKGGKNGGAPRFERKELPEGLVEVSATTPNIQSVRDLAQIAETVLDAVGVRRERLAVALPDLAITTAVFPGRGRAPERELRQELASMLPYALVEARCDFWRGRHDEVLAAAVREMVALQYEQIVEAVECRLAWVDAVSLSGIPSWSRRPSQKGELDVCLQLYAGHYCLTVFREGELVDARTKLRTADDVELVCREVLRVPALHVSADSDDQDSIDSLSLFGADTAPVAAVLEDSSRVRAIRIETDDEDRHLESSIETLLARGSP